MKIVISPGHGKLVRGASSAMMDEVDQARRVVPQLANELRKRKIEVITFQDDVSKTQSDNLWWLSDHHNSVGKHDYDISVHFNAFEQRTQAVGTEVWYCTQESLARRLSAAMASVGWIDRGAKKSTSLHMLTQTVAPSVLLEVCFVDSQADCEVYFKSGNFEKLCKALANEFAPAREQIDEGVQEFVVEGRCSHFGGPEDTGVSPSEGLAWIYSVDEQPSIFLGQQPPNTSGLARRLDPATPYVACRFYPKNDADAKAKMRPYLLAEMALVEAMEGPSKGKFIKCWPADWGPAGPESDHDTGRVADLSPGAMEYLGLTTDQTCRVTFPFTHRLEV